MDGLHGKVARRFKFAADIWSVAGIQNIDFSQRLTSSPRTEGRAPAQNRSPVELSRLLGWGLAGAILVFTGGILAGLKIADLRNIDKNLVKYPDKERSRSFANVGDSDHGNQTRRSDNQPEEIAGEAGSAPETENQAHPANNANTPTVQPEEPAAIIIRIGAYRPSRAGELARSLNNLPELERIPFFPCRGRQDVNPARSHVFSLPSEDGRVHRLFAGCYRTEEDAKKALQIFQKTGVASLKDAKAYQLTQ